MATKKIAAKKKGKPGKPDKTLLGVGFVPGKKPGAGMGPAGPVGKKRRY